MAKCTGSIYGKSVYDDPYYQLTWICRIWTKYSDGWQSDFTRFATRSEAVEYGELISNMNCQDGINTKYEVYHEEV